MGGLPHRRATASAAPMFSLISGQFAKHLLSACRLSTRAQVEEDFHTSEGLPGLQLHRPHHWSTWQHAEAHAVRDQHQDCYPGQRWARRYPIMTRSLALQHHAIVATTCLPALRTLPPRCAPTCHGIKQSAASKVLSGQGASCAGLAAPCASSRRPDLHIGCPPSRQRQGGRGTGSQVRLWRGRGTACSHHRRPPGRRVS